MIKVLVATAKTQGMRPNDYHWCIEGELVWFPPVCRRDKDDPDGGCGCGRGFGGLNSRRGTTTAMVKSIPALDRDDYVEALRSSLHDQGYDGSVAPEVADAMLDLVSDMPEGAIVENRLEYIQLRHSTL